MTRAFFVLILLIFGSAVILAQGKTSDTMIRQIKSLGAETQIKLEYDPVSNYSKLMLVSDGFGSQQNKKNGLSSLTFGMMYGYNGRELIERPPVFILTFWAKGKNTHFIDSHFWRANVDGEYVDFGDARYAAKKGDEREFLNFVVAREKLEKVSRGKNVLFTIGDTEFKVSAEQLQMFANLLRISDPN